MLTGRELGLLLHLPNEDEARRCPALRKVGSRALAPAPAAVVTLQETALPLIDPRWGLAAEPPDKRAYGWHVGQLGQPFLVGQPLEDTRTHTFIVGATGTGKSVLGANLVLQDWLAGHGALVIDPHRTLVEDIMQGVPPEREEDVLILDPAYGGQPFRYNLFDAAGNAETAVERLMAALRVGEGASWDTSVGMQEVLFNALVIALHGPEPASMVVLESVLDEKRRKQMLQAVTDSAPQVQQALRFWQAQFPAWNKMDQQRAVTAAARRVKPFTTRARLRRTLGMAGRTVDLAAALNAGKLVLCPMHNEMGADTKRIWSTLLLQETLAVLKGRRAGADLPPVTVAIDELAESVGTLAEGVSSLLTETRKYGGATILMNQSYVSLPREVQQVIIGNCRTQVVLNVGAEDARVAAQVLGGEVTAEDVMALRGYRGYVRPAVEGNQEGACLVQTLPPLRAGRDVLPAPPPQMPPGVPSPNDPQPQNPGMHLDVADLLRWAQWVKPESEGASGLRDTLLALPEETYGALCRLKGEQDRWLVGAVQQQPGMATPKLRRLQLLSRLRYGVAWWQSDVDYLRWEARQKVLADSAAAAGKATSLMGDSGGRPQKVASGQRRWPEGKGRGAECDFSGERGWRSGWRGTGGEVLPALSTAEEAFLLADASPAEEADRALPEAQAAKQGRKRRKTRSL